MNTKLQKAARVGVIALSVGILGRFGYKFMTEDNHPTPPLYNTTPAASTPTDDLNEEITITVLNPKSSCPDPLNPLEAVLTQAQDYVKSHSWKDIVRQYAGVPGGVIVSIQDYQGKDKEQACRLALGRLVETTLGSVVDRTSPEYKSVVDWVIWRGLNDCTKDITLSPCQNYDAQGRVTKDTRCYGVRFGL